MSRQGIAFDRGDTYTGMCSRYTQGQKEQNRTDQAAEEQSRPEQVKTNTEHRVEQTEHNRPEQNRTEQRTDVVLPCTFLSSSLPPLLSVLPLSVAPHLFTIGTETEQI
jgi:hypothetical protein